MKNNKIRVCAMAAMAACVWGLLSACERTIPEELRPAETDSVTLTIGVIAEDWAS